MPSAEVSRYRAVYRALVQSAKHERDLEAALKAELQLEHSAGNSDPFICFDWNKAAGTMALYIAVDEGPGLAPLGVCIRRFFSRHKDFLWLERSKNNPPSSRWSAVLVTDGLAEEEMLEGSESELVQLLSRSTDSPLHILTTERKMLEQWLPTHTLPNQELAWQELASSPLPTAARLASLESANAVLRRMRRRQTWLRGGLIVLAALTVAAAAGWLLETQVQPPTGDSPSLPQRGAGLIRALAGPAQPIPVTAIIVMLGGENPRAQVRITDDTGQSKELRLRIGQNIGAGDEQWQVTAIDPQLGITFMHLRTGKITLVERNKTPADE